MRVMNRIVLLDETGDELFSGFSISSAPPPPVEDEEACPPTMRSIAPPLRPQEESGIFVREEEKKVDENAA
jgi:hypothetical protein